jgi:hypothetical protein
MTYVGSADAQRANLVSASVVNKAGRTIPPTSHRYPATQRALSRARIQELKIRVCSSSVAKAVADFATEFNRGASSIDIVDAPGNESYPLAYISYISLPKNLSGDGVDCSLVVELLSFFSWTQTNQVRAVVSSSLFISH